MQPVRQTFRESVEAGLCGAVDVVRLAAAVARHRADHDERAGLPVGREVLGRELQPQGRAGEIDVDDASGLVGAVLGLGLLAQHAIGQKHFVRQTCLVQQRGEASLGRTHIAEVVGDGLDARGTAGHEIGRDRPQTLRMTPHQHQCRAIPGALTREGAGDGRSGAEHQDGPARRCGGSAHRRCGRKAHAASPVTRRQKSDEMAGSR